MSDINLPLYATNPGMGSTPKGMVYAIEPYKMAKTIHKLGKHLHKLKPHTPKKTWRSPRKKRS